MTEKEKRRRAQLDKQAAQLIACDYHPDTRYLKTAPDGCPVCHQLFLRGRAPDNTFLPGHSGNPGGKKPGTREMRGLLRRYAGATDERGRTMQEKIARLIVEGAAAGDEVMLKLYLERFDPVSKQLDVDVSDHREPREQPQVLDEDGRDAELARLMRDYYAELGGKTPNVVPGPDTEQ